MTNDEQKKIFSKNLNYYLSLNNKQQKDVANDLGIGISTFNNWCKGVAIPPVSKIQILANYFRISQNDLIEDRNKMNTDQKFSSAIIYIAMNDSRFQQIIVDYCDMPKEKQELFCDFYDTFIGNKGE